MQERAPEAWPSSRKDRFCHWSGVDRSGGLPGEGELSLSAQARSVYRKSPRKVRNFLSFGRRIRVRNRALALTDDPPGILRPYAGCGGENCSLAPKVPAYDEEELGPLETIRPMSIPILSDVLKWLLSRRREQVVDARTSTTFLAGELDGLADLMDTLLQVTGPDGRVVRERAVDLEFQRRRIWNRWGTILDSRGFASRDAHIQAEIERCIEISHAAPGAYVHEIYLVQIALSEGFVPGEVRVRFAESIERLRNMAVKLRLNAMT